jgi:hypothetical protein
MGLFKVGVPKKKKKGLQDFGTLYFVNAIYLKQI